MKGIRIDKGGMLTTIQDGGRFGFQSYGIPQSGYMDGSAADQANYLVGNDKGSALLECTYVPPAISFQKNFIIALTGADMHWTIDNFSVPRFTSLYVKKGSQLKGKVCKHGARAYLAIQGNMIIDRILNSQSTFLPAKLGGYSGLKLTSGDVIPLEKRRSKWEFRYIRDSKRPSYKNQQSIFADAGPEWYRLNQQSKYKLIKGIECCISKESDRMASRLETKPLQFKNNSPFPSKPVFPGIVQLPQSGKPIVILNDGQTIGGYPRIAVISQEQLHHFNQIRLEQSFNLFVKPHS